MNACVQLPAGDEFRSGAKFFYHLIRKSETRLALWARVSLLWWRFMTPCARIRRKKFGLHGISVEIPMELLYNDPKLKEGSGRHAGHAFANQGIGKNL